MGTKEHEYRDFYKLYAHSRMDVVVYQFLVLLKHMAKIDYALFLFTDSSMISNSQL